MRHGARELLIPNTETAFTAELTKATLRYSKTGRRKITAYHPRSNGLSERLKETIADMSAIT